MSRSRLLAPFAGAGLLALALSAGAGAGDAGGAAASAWLEERAAALGVTFVHHSGRSGR